MALFEVHHHVHYHNRRFATLDDLKALEARLMSALSDAIQAATTEVDAAIVRVTTDVNDFKAQIAALQATVDSGGATPADLQALADLKAKAAGIDPHNPATLPPTPPAPPAPAPSTP